MAIALFAVAGFLALCMTVGFWWALLILIVATFFIGANGG